MAGAGQPFYMPLLWPVGNLMQASAASEKDEVVRVDRAVASLDLTGHLTSMAASLRSFLLAYFFVHYLYDNTSPTESYPAFGPAKEFSQTWVLPIVVRNLIGTLLICGFWDWILYFSPLKPRLRKYKFTIGDYPGAEQFIHDFAFTLLSSVVAAGLECALCFAWANGYLRYQTTEQFWNTWVINAIAVLTVTHWRVPHFWAIHRFMHPWRVQGVPDLGKFFYKHVHSLHHKSYNPTAFSGTSMHPVESFLYYSAALLAVPFGAHPVIPLAVIVDCAVGAWFGHDGYQWPGSGDFFHQLHHRHFDCNYGAMHFPIDKWLGTFISCQDDLRRDRTGRGPSQAKAD
eukprot:Hpha_TRINITY_DN14982_c1_g2::TRINITY_DN14982_c1_g2_i1::g.143333::m.143333